jgi:hypothetical protein
MRDHVKPTSALSASPIVFSVHIATLANLEPNLNTFFVQRPFLAYR